MGKKYFNSFNKLIYIICLLVFVSCTQSKIKTHTLPYDRGQRLAARHAMVSSAHPLASKIGIQIMKEGGNAVDAAVATAFAVSIVEPEMSGLGGGGGMVIWLAQEKRAYFIDFYVSKRVATYRGLPEDRSEPNLLSVGIPGEVAGLLYAQKKYGNLTRQEVMQPAIDLARKGFPMYQTLAQYIKADSAKLIRYKGGDMYLPHGKVYPVGKIFKQTDLAKSLQTIAEKGHSAFYNGEITKDIIKVMNKNGNPVTMTDFQNYEVRVHKKPLKGTYHQWIVLSAAPPQTGMEVIESLNLLDSYHLKKMGLPTQSDSAFHILTAAMRMGRADKQAYMDDPNWGRVPTKILTSQQYADKIANYVYKVPISDSLMPGNIAAFEASPVTKIDDHNTTSLSVVDSRGNAVALTQTNSSLFGSGAWVDGFFLNNSGIDLSEVKPDTTFVPKSKYRIRPSTISPTIILNQDSTVKMIIGSPGGGHIPTAIVQTVVYMLDYGMDPMAALRMPRIYPSINTPWVYVEKHFKGSVLNAARKMGYKVHRRFSNEHARVYVVEKKDGYWVGAADPYHEGGVAGY